MAVKGKYHNPKDSKMGVIKVEAWCDRYLYIWNWFEGRTGKKTTRRLSGVSHCFRVYSVGSTRSFLPEEYRILPSGGAGIYPSCPIFALSIHKADGVR